MGHHTPEGTRAELGFTGGGPEWLVTELGVFDYDGDGHARLRQVFPDVSLADVESATGFGLAWSQPTCVPSRRPAPPSWPRCGPIDPLGVRRAEFSADELRRTFTHGEGADCAC